MSVGMGAGADFFLLQILSELKTERPAKRADQDDTPFSAAFDELRTRSFIISFTFEG